MSKKGGVEIYKAKIVSNSQNLTITNFRRSK